MKIAVSDYFEILHRSIHHDRSLFKYTQPEMIEILDKTYRGTYLDINVEAENYPAFTLHCIDSASNFDCYIEWL